MLIAVGRGPETMKQIDSQLMMRNYEGFLGERTGRPLGSWAAGAFGQGTPVRPAAVDHYGIPTSPPATCSRAVAEGTSSGRQAKAIMDRRW